MKDISIRINTKKYIEEYLKIKTKDSKIINFKLNKPQQKLYDVLAKQHREGKPQRAIVLKARQMGFSTLTEAIIFKKTATAKNVNSGIVAHIEPATNNLFNMSKLYYDELPEALKPQIRTSNAQELVFNNKSGTGLRSKIKCMTAGGKGIGRSDTLQNLHISEYAFWGNNKKELLTGLLQAVPNTLDSLIIIESTANGYDDFKNLWDMAVNGESDFIPIFCGWNEMEEYRTTYDGFELTEEELELKTIYNLDNEQIAWRRWAIKNQCQGDVNAFKQEYPISPHEAFVLSGECIFDKEQIVKRLSVVPEPIKRGMFEYEYNGLEITNIRWIDDKNGYVKIYNDVEPGNPYVIGGDTSGDGSDNFVGQVIDNIAGKQSAVLCHTFDEDLYARQMYCLGMYYNMALVGIEANFSTYPIKELVRLGYPKQFLRKHEDTYSGRVADSFGFKTTSVTRPIIIAELTQIAREKLHLINDRTTLEEMLTFVKNERGKPEAINGKHDDHVIALAIAYYIRFQQDTFISVPKKAKKKLPHALDTDNEYENNGVIEW